MNPFDYFKNIYCINLDRRTDRWLDVQEEFKSVGILDRVNRFPAIESPDGRLGLVKSFLHLFKLAREKNMENILIFEDDVKFINNPLENLDKALKQSVDFKWSMFYLGANTHNKLIKIRPNLCVLKNAYSAHAVVYDSKIYNKIIDKFDSINKVEKQSDINDVFLSSLQDKYTTLMVNPIIATQKESYSDLEKRVVNYTFIEERFKKNIL
jgi:GR25 family glycosyltransferase involved in LPS biosynthesis